MSTAAVTLAVWADLRVPEVLAGAGAVKVRSVGREAVDDVLYDAADLRLLRSGVQLRQPADGTWHAWVSPSPMWHRDCGTDVVLHTEPVVEGRPPEVLVGLLRGAPLTAAVTVRVRRRTWTVTEPDPRPDPAPIGLGPGASSEPEPPRPDPVPIGWRADAGSEGDPAEPGATDSSARPDPAPIGPLPGAGSEVAPVGVEVVLEDLALLTGRRVSARRALVRVTGDADLADRLVSRFEAAGAEVLEDEAPPVLDLLGGRVRRPVVPDPSRKLAHDASAGEVVGLAITRAVSRLLANDLAIRLDLGPEGVHQARVATRRLRSDLKTFGGLLEPLWAGSTRDDLRWLAGALGEVRDADVLAERLGERIARLDAADQETAGWLLDEVIAQRAAAGDRLDDVLAEPRYLALLDSLVAAANHPALTAAADAEAVDTFDELARRAWKPLRKAARRVVAAEDPLAVPVDEVHDVRIRAKRFRYAADAAAPVDRAAARHAAVLATLQDELGELNDAAVAEAWLRAQLPQADAEQAFVLGQLVAAERAELAARRASWLGPWRAVNRRKRRAWLAS